MKKSAKRRDIVKAASGEADECFTIMPYGGWFDEYYEQIFLPAITSAGLVPKRADDLYRPSAIVHDIWLYTKRAKLILADLSEKNPNVFYELGLAHAIAKPAILVTQSMEDVPFDLRALRVIEYDKNAPAWGEDLKSKIRTAITEVLASPLQAVLPSFLEVSRSEKISVTEQEKEMLGIRQELELLRRETRLSREAHFPYTLFGVPQGRSWRTTFSSLDPATVDVAGGLVTERIPFLKKIGPQKTEPPKTEPPKAEPQSNGGEEKS